MVIHNNDFAFKIKKKIFFSVVALFSLIILTIAIDTILGEFNSTYTVNYVYRFILIVGVTLMFFAFLRSDFKRDYNFIYFSDEDANFLVFRFYPLLNLKKKYTTYKIPVTSFHKHEIIREDEFIWLVLYQEAPQNKIAKYPPLNINGLNEVQILSLHEVLQNKLLIK
ncbi:MAG: hypothetical protein R6U95_04635 [Bacteroidales bacterium]